MKIDFSGISKKIKAFLTSKDVLIFSLFVLLSTAIWFMNALSTNKEMRLSIPIEYAGLPENILVLNPLPENVSMRVQDNGKNLMAYYKKRNYISPIIIDLAGTRFDQEGALSISKAQIRQKIRGSLQNTTELLSFSPDTIGIRYATLTSKHVPVIFDGEATPAPQHMFKQSPRLLPDSITVFCTEQAAPGITCVKTQRAVFSDIEGTLSETVMLQPVENVRFSRNSVRLAAEAEMFTEKSFTLPIKPVNMPPHLSVRTFPADATIMFNIGVSDFNSIDADDVEILFNYEKLRSGSNKHELEAAFGCPADHVFNIRIKPNEVEYILETEKTETK